MKYRDHLPQLDGGTFVTDSGLETELIFHDGLELPAFAAFDLLKDEAGTGRLRRYYESYADLAAEHGLGLVLEAPTWRANPRWAAEIGYGEDELVELNRKAVALMEEVREAREQDAPFVISGCVGPHEDGYAPGETLPIDSARDYHATQVTTFSQTAADMVSAITMTYVEEAIGIARAAADVGIPAVLSFTVETDGRLPSGQPLGEAIEQTDRETEGSVAYFMINCAHPTHFEHVLEPGQPWLERIRGLRANASTQSHAELDEATELDAGDPKDLGARYAALGERLPRLNVLGGCCGTDLRHVTAVCEAWVGGPAARV